MRNRRQKLAELICHGEAVLNPKKWLAEEVGDLAVRIPNLDEIPSQSILPLAKLVVEGETDVGRLALMLDIDEVLLEEHLEVLAEFNFAERTRMGYKATPTGEHAFDAVGQRMLDRELFQMKARLQQLEQIRGTP